MSNKGGSAIRTTKEMRRLTKIKEELEKQAAKRAIRNAQLSRTHRDPPANI